MSEHYDKTPHPPGELTDKLRRSRMGELWAGLILAAAVLVLLMIFMVQNDQSVTVSFLWATGDVPLGVALLLATVGGVLVVAVPGTIRIVQLRRLIRSRDRRAK